MKAFPINFGDFTKSQNSSPNTKDQVQTRATLIWGTRDATRLEEEQEQPAGPQEVASVSRQWERQWARCRLHVAAS